MNTFFLRFHLLSPMQIGAGSLGMIEKTLLYIPGRVLWGAVVSGMTRLLFPEPADEHYIQIGHDLPVEGFSSFFPEIDGVRMFPVIPDRKWISPEKPGLSISFSEMESALLTSAASTAIAPDWMSAARGSLHATDLISPVRTGKNGKSIPVSFSGYIRFPDSLAGQSLSEPLIRRVFDSARIGGGRKRGWGRIRTDKIELCPAGYDGFRKIPVSGGVLLTADTDFSPELHVSGEIRLLSCREHDPEKGSGQRFSEPKLVWSAGSMIYDSAS